MGNPAKGFALIAVFLGAVVILVFTGGGWWVYQNAIRQPAEKNQNVGPQATSTPQAAETYWKSYRSEVYGFAIEYPPGWIHLNRSSSTVMIIEASHEATDAVDIAIEALTEYGGKDWSAVLNDPEMTRENCRAITFAGESAYGCDNIGPFGFYETLVKRDNTFFSIQDQFQTATSTKIISTFRFIDHVSTWKTGSQKTEEPVVDQTADWKTYRSEKHGFEVGYPSGWFLNPFGDFGAVELTSVPRNTYGEGGVLPRGSASISISKHPYIQIEIAVEEDLRGADKIYSRGVSMKVGEENAVKNVAGISYPDKVLEQEIGIYIAHNSSLYKIFLNYHENDQKADQYLKIFDNFLLTFKFTK